MRTDNQMLIGDINGNAIIAIFVIIAIVLIVQYIRNRPKNNFPTVSSELRKLNK